MRNTYNISNFHAIQIYHIAENYAARDMLVKNMSINTFLATLNFDIHISGIDVNFHLCTCVLIIIYIMWQVT